MTEGPVGRSPAWTRNPGRVLWDLWYTMKLGGNSRYGYFNDRVEDRGDSVFFKNDVWKRQGDFINRETIGVLGKNDDGISPLFFDYHSRHRLTETTLEGTIRSSVILDVRVQRDSGDPRSLRCGIPRGAFLSTFFPLWLGRHLLSLDSLGPGHRLPFETIKENGLASRFQPVQGGVELEKPDALATRLRARRLTVDFRGDRSFWWVDPRGAPYRIVFPRRKLVIERASREDAMRVLNPENATRVVNRGGQTNRADAEPGGLLPHPSANPAGDQPPDQTGDQTGDQPGDEAAERARHRPNVQARDR